MSKEVMSDYTKLRGYEPLFENVSLKKVDATTLYNFDTSTHVYIYNYEWS